MCDSIIYRIINTIHYHTYNKWVILLERLIAMADEYSYVFLPNTKIKDRKQLVSSFLLI